MSALPRLRQQVRGECKGALQFGLEEEERFHVQLKKKTEEGLRVTNNLLHPSELHPLQLKN